MSEGAVVVSAAGDPAPLSSAQLSEIELADTRVKQVGRAVKLAAWNGWSLALSALSTAAFSLSDPTLLLFALVLGGIAYVELRAGRRLRAYDPTALRRLFYNQTLLMVVIIGYAGYGLFATITNPNPLSAALADHPELSALDDPQVKDLALGFGDITRTVTLAVYVVMIVLSLLFQGGSALYYRTREKYLDAFLAATPAWIRELQRRRA